VLVGLGSFEIQEHDGLCCPNLEERGSPSVSPIFSFVLHLNFQRSEVCRVVLDYGTRLAEG